MATAARRREISDQFLEQAQQEYRRGDLLQASEKAWGAVSHYISAMAEERGWSTGKHQRTVKNARCILDEHPDPEPYLTLFNSVMSLHINFYEELFDDRQVQAGIRDALRLVRALKKIDDVRAGKSSFPVRALGGPM